MPTNLPHAACLPPQINSWSSQKSFITAEIDEGKGFTIQKSTTTWRHGRARVVNNVAYANGLSGIHINIGRRVDIAGNTLANNHRYGRGRNLGISLADTTDVNVVNNIVYTSNTWPGFALSVAGNTAGIAFRNNLVSGDVDPITTALATGGPTIFGDPKFADLSNADFHVQAGSPAIAAGLAGWSAATDFDGVARTSPVTIGAFQYA